MLITFGVTLNCFSAFFVILTLLVIVGYKYSIRENNLIFQNKRILSSEKEKFNLLTKLTHIDLSKQNCENKGEKREEEGGNITISPFRDIVIKNLIDSQQKEDIIESELQPIQERFLFLLSKDKKLTKGDMIGLFQGCQVGNPPKCWDWN